MKPEYFAEKFDRKSIIDIKQKKQKEHDFSIYSNLKKITEFIDFGCKFTKKGKCKEYATAMCCCHNCAYAVGYLNFVPKHKLEIYTKAFSEKTGFWRKDKGCILSRELRSTLCLTHNCNYKNQNFRDSLWALSKTLQKMERLMKGE